MTESNATPDVTTLEPKPAAASMITYRERNKPERRMRDIISLGPNGHPHAKGTVIETQTGAYMAARDGSLRRVRVLSRDGDLVRVAPIKRLNRKEKKALKRGRHR